MRIKILALGFISVALAFSYPTSVCAQQSKTINFDCRPAIRENTGSAKIISIVLDAQNVLLEYGYQPDSYLFTDEALFAINHKSKTYRFQTYDELEARVRRDVEKYTKPWRDTNIELTEEPDRIHGLKIRKLIRREGRRTEDEVWVSSDLLPRRLRAVGERIRAILPADFWKKAPSIPHLEAIILLYGIPLKMIVNRHFVCQSEIHEMANSNSPFKVPATYKKVKVED